jgi:hypothetical protein
MAKQSKPTKEAPVAVRLIALVGPKLMGFLGDATKTSADTVGLRAQLPTVIAGKIDKMLTLPRARGYRDGLIIQTATGLIGELAEQGHTYAGRGGRGAAQSIGKLLAENHIKGVVDAYQNIGKNIPLLARGVQPDFDDVLRWLDEADELTRSTALDYMLASVALTARAVLPQPDFEQAKLTFHACAVFLHALLEIPSAGAYQQFACAAFLEALIDEFGQGGVGGLRVDTKKLNASDASSKVNGDIQVIRGNRLEEAFEVTANPWRTKVATALAAGKQADLQRVHIIAEVERDFPENSGELAVEGVDLTVIDVHAYLRTLMAIMRKPARASALVRLYQLLDRNQPDIERTNAYVRLLRSHGLATT